MTDFKQTNCPFDLTLFIHQIYIGFKIIPNFTKNKIYEIYTGNY